MNLVEKVEFYAESKEERLPNFESDFPYTMSCAKLDKYIGRFAPWHWHKAVELFYMESGTLEYNTPKGKMVFPAGSGGFVNSNVLHMTRTVSHTEENVQLLHIFDPSFISGNQGSRIEKRYILPIVTSPQMEILGFFPEQREHAAMLGLIREAFCLKEHETGYEIKIREALSRIWMLIFEGFYSQCSGNVKADKNDERLKTMLIYIHEHFADKIPVSELASTVYLSERECFRLFRNYLHVTPTEYIRGCRLRAACQMLANGRESITNIGRACGLGDGSYFGKIFREYAGCTPMEYRRKWQDRNRNCPK